MQAIADSYFLTKPYLSNYIRKNLGMSFSELVSMKRCESAVRLLGLTNKTVDQIAMEVGFSSRNNLSKQFQKWYKITPTEYRNRIQEDLNQEIDLWEKTFDEKTVQDTLKEFLEGL